MINSALDFVIFWVLHSVVCWLDTNVSEDRAVSIFTVQPWKQQIRKPRILS